MRRPFNACDYLCDRCLETECCEIFALLQRKALSRRTEGTRDNAQGASLEDVRESLDETMEILKQMAARLTIEVEEGAGLAVLERGDVDDDDLYLLAHAFTVKTHAFLKTLEPFIKPGQRAAFDDLVWYHRMVSVKTRRAVASDYGGLSEDAVDSAGVATKSLVRCIEAFEDIRRDSRFGPDLHQLSTTAVEIRRRLRKRFSRNAGLENHP